MVSRPSPYPRSGDRGAAPLRAPATIPAASRSRLVYPALQRLVRGVLGLAFRLRVRGAGHVPGTGPVLLVANHPSLLDPFFVGAMMRRRPGYLVYTTFYRAPLLRGWVRFFGGIEVGAGGAARSLEAARGALEAGRALEVFPEGGRSPGGRVAPFQRGFARLARLTGAPVVPIAIVGADRVWPYRQRLPRLARVEVIFGSPLSLAASSLPARQQERQFTEEVRQAVIALADGRLQEGDAAW